MAKFNMMLFMAVACVALAGFASATMNDIMFGKDAMAITDALMNKTETALDAIVSKKAELMAEGVSIIDGKVDAASTLKDDKIGRLTGRYYCEPGFCTSPPERRRALLQQSSVCVECGPDAYCPGGFQTLDEPNRVPCPAPEPGSNVIAFTTGNVSTASSRNQCLAECAPGRYAPDSARGPCEPCGFNFYCLGGIQSAVAEDRIPCSPGTETVTQFAEDEDACLSIVCGIDATTTLYSQDFAEDASGWVPFGGGSMVQNSDFMPTFRVSPGVGQVQRSAGTTGPFTRFRPDGSGPLFTDFLTAAPNGFITQLAIYLNTTDVNGLANDTRFDWDVALNTKEDVRAQDFVFNAGFYTDIGGPGSGERRFIVTASNQAGRANSDPKDPARDPVAILNSGWYIFQHKVYADEGLIYVDLSIWSADCREQVNSWTLQAFIGSQPFNVSEAGYPAIGWFARNELPSLDLTVDEQLFAVIDA